MQNNQRINLYETEEYLSCLSSLSKWSLQHMDYYNSLLCLKEIKNTGSKELTIENSYSKMERYINNSLEDVLNHNKPKRCILPLGHIGKCTPTVHEKLFPDKRIHKKIEYIYISSGDDDYICKNRTQRTFPFPISKRFETLIKDKEEKKKCGIPLSEATTPYLQASAYFDYLVLLLSIKDIRVNKHMDLYKDIIPIHIDKLREFYGRFNRKIFNDQGNVICPITRELITINDLLSDSRYDPKGIHLSHAVPRTDYEFTIRGFNILMMSREGNRILGNHSFLEDVWINNLKKIVSYY